MKKRATMSAWCVFDGLIGYLLILVNQLIIVYTIIFYGRYWLIQLESWPWFMEFFAEEEYGIWLCRHSTTMLSINMFPFSAPIMAFWYE